MPFYKWTSSRFDTVLAIGFIFVMAIAMPSYADEVTLRSGDVIHGKVLCLLEAAPTRVYFRSSMVLSSVTILFLDSVDIFILIVF